MFRSQLVICFTESACVSVCVRLCACTWTLVAWLAVCVRTVSQDAAESCAWSGDVMMSCGFSCFAPLPFLAWSICWQPFEMSIFFFVTTKASKIGGFLWKKTCPKNNVACWNYILALFSQFSQFVFHCFFKCAYWTPFPVLAAFVVVLFVFFLFVSRKWWFKIAEDMLSTTNHGDSMPYRSFLLSENCKKKKLQGRLVSWWNLSTETTLDALKISRNTGWQPRADIISSPTPDIWTPLTLLNFWLVYILSTLNFRPIKRRKCVSL